MLSRSKERIKEFGEVFTPEHVVKEIDLMSKSNPNVWSDLEYAFFEPTCGTGNFVVAIYTRRLEAIKNLGIFEAITATINTLWAITLRTFSLVALELSMRRLNLSKKIWLSKSQKVYPK